jgi:hypothetical protein
MKNFKFFIGIDQTGAIDQKGKPKKLRACIYQQKTQEFVFCFIEELTWACLAKKLPNLTRKNEVFILIDSVFGLPQKSHHLDQSIRELIHKTQTYEFENKAYGLKTAHQFFIQFKPQSADHPKRKVEVQVEANSLFLLHPFQKNISCGTYRIWKELSQDQSWFQIWPFEKPNKNTVYLAEGYPSYYWRKIFNLKTRNTDQLLQVLPLAIKKQIQKQKAHLSPDSMDAFVLAYSAEKILKLEDRKSVV